ncbi:hypothetical protein J3R30DRAFT_2110905 [Lentinula aciculospora]|uniref:GSKIP domain-containing protein n=1 Tax=Lentinula aciculospora TaxID=153920 RepID=A0A9W9AG93_9AGAR|nr:hypothetical protein J3R30DRAFT_2110905 [Lentinula aciculospora]
MNPSEFYIKELQSVLSEQALLIRTFSMDNSSSLQATASVTLLEGDIITITLTNRGYHSHQAKGIIFESIENLLQSVSPLYARKRHSVLLDALDKWTSRQSPDEEGEDKRDIRQTAVAHECHQ